MVAVDPAAWSPFLAPCATGARGAGALRQAGHRAARGPGSGALGRGLSHKAGGAVLPTVGAQRAGVFGWAEPPGSGRVGC